MNNLINKIQETMKHFKNSYINNNLEVILLPKTNGYFAIKNCKNEIELIYNKLGNGINHKLTKKFVESDFNMEVLK